MMSSSTTRWEMFQDEDEENRWAYGLIVPGRRREALVNNRGAISPALSYETKASWATMEHPGQWAWRGKDWASLAVLCPSGLKITHCKVNITASWEEEIEWEPANWNAFEKLGVGWRGEGNEQWWGPGRVSHTAQCLPQIIKCPYLY